MSADTSAAGAERAFGFRTRALHAGTPPDPATGARALPIYMSSSFVFDSTEHAAELFALRTYGNIYSRIGNPTVAAFEEKMASLEGGLGGVATASALAAQLTRFSRSRRPAITWSRPRVSTAAPSPNSRLRSSGWGST